MRNRWYDPAMGRFVTADPMGYVDGPSSYSFAGGDPANRSDPFGLYAEDGHYYTVLIVALELGFSEEEAEVLAFFAQLPDEVSEFDAIELRKHSLSGGPLGELDRDFALRLQRYLHALTGTNSIAETNWTAWAISQSSDLATTGILLHRLGDTFSHRTLENQRVLYRSGNGHLKHYAKPDELWRRPELYTAYVTKMSQSLADRYALRLGLGSAREITAASARAVHVAANLGHFAALGARAVGENDAASHSTELFRAAAERRLGRTLEWKPEDQGIDHVFSLSMTSRVKVPDVTGPYLSTRACSLRRCASYSANNVYRAIGEAFNWLIPVPSRRVD